MSQPVRIMIVEDEMVVALDLASRLGRLGYDICDNVPSGEEAIRQVDTLRPDLVLMDISLSGDLDGIEAAQQMRTRYDLPIIYLTANTDETTLRRAQLTHPANYLLKPFKERELQICIEMATGIGARNVYTATTSPRRSGATRQNCSVKTATITQLRLCAIRLPTANGWANCVTAIARASNLSSSRGGRWSATIAASPGRSWWSTPT